MTMTPRLRKLTLTAHVTSSVGWLGAVVAYLALAITGLTHPDAQLVRATYLAMELIGWFVIVPFSRRVSQMSGIAAETTLSSADFGMPRLQLVVHAGGGLLVLLAATALSVFKPRGRTRYGQHPRSASS
jgi:hypothetical protein